MTGPLAPGPDSRSSLHAGGSGVLLRSGLYEDWSRLFPVQETVKAQVKPGVFDLRGVAVNTGPVVFGRVQLEAAVVGHSVPESGTLGMFVPLVPGGTHVYNGCEVSPGAFFLSTSPDGYSLRGEKRVHLCVGIRRAPLVDTLAALTGMQREDVRLPEGVFEQGLGEAARLRHAFLSILHGAVREGRSELSALETLDAGDRLLMAIARALPASPGTRPQASPRRVPALTIMRRAQEYLRANANRRVNLADLCAATGVGSTTLHAAFQEAWGAPPMTLVRLYRLTRIRTALLLGAPTRGAVKRIASEHGITEHGRFAGEYRELFGELPSATLERDVTRRLSVTGELGNGARSRSR